MLPVLFEVFGFPINSYGLSKALAGLSAAYLLGREFRRRGWNPDHAWTMVMVGAVLGFLGAKIYYLLENINQLTPHLFGGSGFTWYGGLIAGALSITVMARRYRVPVGEFAGMAAAPLSLAYGIGRIGCFLSGDGTYGKPSDLPWAMAFPNGMIPTFERVHPTALYEAIIAIALAGVLWALRARLAPVPLFGLYAVASGLARFLVEELRINDEVLLGLTQPQLWSLLLAAVGAVLLLRASQLEPGGDTAQPAGDYSRSGF